MADSADPTEEHPNEDLQAKMRAALDRKHEAEREGQAHLDDQSAAHHTHGKEGGPRQFRRKAGP